MDSKEILYSAGSNDECYTPKYWVLPLVKHLDNFAKKFLKKNELTKKDKKNIKVWCPFDSKDSEFVKVFEEEGYTVIKSHISQGQDYYEYEPKEWDIMISNPPFTNKRKIFERALSFWKPFCLLMSLTWLNDSAPKILFMEKDLQLLMFDKRMKFYNNGTVNNKITFSSGYYCYDFLEKQIVMEKLNDKI